MKNWLLVLIIIGLTSCSLLKTKKVNKLQFIGRANSRFQYESPVDVIAANIDMDELQKWQKDFSKNVTMVCADNDEKRNLEVQVILQPKGYPIINFSSFPKYGNTARQAYEQKLKGYPAPNTKYTPIALRFSFKFMGGIIKFAEKPKPELISLASQTFEEFKKLKLSKFQKLSEIANNQIKPTLISVLSNKQSNASQKLAQELAKDFNQNFAELPMFWQSYIEANNGELLEPLLLAVQATCMQKYELARLYIYLFSPFVTSNSASSYYFAELSKHIEELYAEFDKYIEENGAEKALALYPKSASLWHSFYKKDFYLKNEKEFNKEYEKNVYANNHLFPDMLISLTPKQLYKKTLKLKFKKQLETQITQKNAVSIAYALFSLKHYDTAALMFWSLRQSLQNSDIDTDLLENFTFCLHKLGIKGIEKVFDIETDGLFTEIEKQQNKIMLENELYKASTLTNKTTEQFLADGIKCLNAQELSWAAKNFSKGIKLEPKMFDLWSYRGLAYMHMGLLKKANYDFDRAARLKPKNVKVRLGIIELKFMSKDYEGCAKLAENTLISTSKANEKALCYFFMLISEYMLKKDLKKTEILFEKVLEQDFLFENWSFSLFEDWLKKSKLSKTDKNYIENVIDQLKDGHY